MDAAWKTDVWRQFGASIDMLDRAIEACPESLWSESKHEPAVWYLVFHTLFWLDFYLADDFDAYRPPTPFGMEETDPEGTRPPRVYTRDELRTFLRHGRARCRAVIDAMSEARATERCHHPWGDLSRRELLLYNMRHVQHGAAQVNLHLRQTTDAAPGWVCFAKT